MAGPEYTDVEKPFIDQLVGQGWEYLAGSVNDPTVAHRGSFAQVVSAITRLPASKMLEANKQATELLMPARPRLGQGARDPGPGAVRQRHPRMGRSSIRKAYKCRIPDDQVNTVTSHTVTSHPTA